MMCKCGVVLSISVVIVSSFILLVTSFNVDTFNYVQHKGPEQSMFGFSVATHKEHGTSWVLVGAPTSQGERSRIQRGGAVYKCSSNSDAPCDEIDFHQKSGTSPADDKNNQWFGATVSSAGPDGPVVACAPRYVWFTTSKEERRDPVGTCYVARDDFRKVMEYSPCRTSFYGYHRQGSCQAGFSAGISKDGRRLFVGAPGSWYWQGQMYSIDPTINFPYTPGILFGEPYGFGVKGQVIQQSLDDRPAVMSTPEGPATEDDSYKGYSMIVGDFKHTGVQGIAVGMPKGGEMLEGKVLLYTWNLTNYLNITGKQMGSYFGYALAAADVDGDGRTDLIIGAPMHVEPNTELKYEVGRVHIIYQGLSSDYANEAVLDGFKSKSRFGLSLSTLGDMNLDGYEDFAVGAPYDGKYERGAVYIFQGSPNGVIKQYSQVIYAEEMQDSYGRYPLSTFGFSIAGGLDLDGNDYPDMAVGAYLSDVAYFFRARPVVRVELFVRFDEPKVIRLDRKTCNKPGNPRIQVPCTWVQVCLRYSGRGAPPRIDLNLQYVLDALKPSYSRIYSSRGSGKEYNVSISLYKDDPLNCDASLRDTIYVKESIADKLTDLEIQVKYSLKEENNAQHYQRDPNSLLLPIIDLSTPAIANDTIAIFKNCGADNVCIPDLHLFVRKEVTKYLYDADNPIEFDIEITNTKDDSYNTKFHVHLPQDIEFRGAPIIDNSPSENKLACSPLQGNASIFACDIGNPLVKNSGVHFKLRVAPKRDHTLLKPTYVFFMNVTSANPENNFTTEDNAITISIDIWVDAILAIEGKSTPSSVYYNVSQYNTAAVAKWDTELGPPVIHSYTIVNKGPSDVNEVEIYIIWPGRTLADEDLLYLVEPPHTLEGVKCEKLDTYNTDLVLSLQQNVWELTGIHKGAGPPGTAEHHIEQNPEVPGNTLNTITRTITVLTFYDVNSQPVHVMEVIGEVGGEAYWKNVSLAASQFKGPLTVQSNSSSLLIHYLDGAKETYSVVSRNPSPSELPYSSYYMNSNVTTVVSYYTLLGNLVEKEYIVEQPGSQAFKDRIKSTKERLRQPLKITTDTTWHFDYTSADGNMRYHYIMHQSGTEEATDGEISTTTIRTIVKFFNSNGNVLSEESVEGEPNTAAYWELINKKVSGFDEPVTMRVTTMEVITYFRNGQQIREEEKPIFIAPEQASLRTTTTTITTIKVTSLSGGVLYTENMPGEKGSQIYNDHFKNILSRIKEPAKIETKTVHTISYRSSTGLEIYRGTYTEILTEPYNPNRIESSSTATVTTITFYDAKRNILLQENITEAVGSAEYWEKINEIMSTFQQQQVSMHVITRQVITYYVNGIEVSSENVEGGNQQPEIIYRPQTDITTTITVFNANGNILDQKTENGKIDVSINNIVNRYREAISIEIKTIYVTSYYNSHGHVTHRGTLTKTETHTHTPTPEETSQVHTITTIIFYDINKHIVYQENITDEVGSERYWDRINSLISRYNQQQITVEVSTNKIITYYVHGQETHSNIIDGSSQEITYRPQIVITTRIIVYGSNGRVLYDQTVAGKGGSTNDIISKYNEPIRVEVHTIHTITYYNSNGQVAYTGVYTEIETRDHRPSHPSPPNISPRESTITTIIIYDSSRNIIYQGEIMEEPQSPAYWDKINKLIMQFQQHQRVTIHITTRTIITYYADGVATHTKDVSKPSGSSDTSITTRIDTSTIVTVYNSNRQVLFEGNVNAEKGSAEYQNYLTRTIDKFRGTPITVVTKTTYTITYYAGGQVLYTGTEYSEETQTHNQHVITDSRTSVSTTIQFFDTHGNLLQQETISDEPKSPQYWEHIKTVITDYNYPLNIYTNSSKVVTYYVNGAETRVEYLPGTVIVPFTTHVDEVVTEITYLDNNNNKIYHETVYEDLSRQAKEKRRDDFAKRYRGSFTVEFESTKTISFRSFDGQVLYSGAIGGGPILPPTENSHTETQTTLMVYASDGTTLLYRNTINGEPGSAAYNSEIVDIINKFPQSITIYTNSTKTITMYNTEGKTVNQQTISEPRSTVQRQRDNQHTNHATTTITFYGPDGQAIHHDVINGAPGPDLHRQLDKIAREYSGVVKSYGGRVNEDGSIGGPITVVNSPYPGGKPDHLNTHFSDFELPHGQQHTQWNSGFNRSGERHGGGYAYGSDSSTSHGINLNVNQGDLGAFARGKGFRTGGIDLGVNSGNVDQSVDGHARSNFESYRDRQAYDGSHNYLSGAQTYQNSGSTGREHHGRRKREVDTTDNDIDKLADCTTSNCFTIKCTSGPIRKGHEVHIALRARVVVKTLKDISMTQPVNIESMILARISRFQEISGSPAQRTLYRQSAITSVMAPSPDIKPDIVPLWVVILSAVAGTLILLLLIFLLHKCGFFKRNRPSDAPERQPLNRNGHFQHGDEAL